jgi:aryl-alcohol dehydrogenase-like predicted oxidoreductase
LPPASKQQHAVPAVLGQPVRHHAAGRTRAHDDEIEFVFAAHLVRFLPLPPGCRLHNTWRKRQEENMIEQRTLGRTGLKVTALGFGCGAVGGLMVRGAPADQERAVARAVELGINYFDTAASYGNGESEKNLGRVLAKLKPNVHVGTKVNVPATEHGRVGAAIAAALEASLKRLGRDSVDLFQLHNHITAAGGGGAFTAHAVIDEVVPAMQRLRQQGKTKFFGITAVGDSDALHEVVAARAIDTMQMPYNLLNPSAGGKLPAGYPAHDFRDLMTRGHEAGVGVIGIRVLAAGALSGEAARHPIAAANVEPIASGSSYAADLARARLLLLLVTEGHAGSLVEAAVRFALSNDAMSTVLIGIATQEQFETAAAAAAKGRLSAAALARVAELQRGFVGQDR